MPEDIYKSHLENVRPYGPTNVDSARQNLAASFVNGFVNCAFGQDKLLAENGNKWLYKNKEHGKLQTFPAFIMKNGLKNLVLSTLLALPMSKFMSRLPKCDNCMTKLCRSVTPSLPGMMSATASLGLILLWDVDGGLTQIDKVHFYTNNNHTTQVSVLTLCYS